MVVVQEAKDIPDPNVIQENQIWYSKKHDYYVKVKKFLKEENLYDCQLIDPNETEKDKKDNSDQIEHDCLQRFIRVNLKCIKANS